MTGAGPHRERPAVRAAYVRRSPDAYIGIGAVPSDRGRTRSYLTAGNIFSYQLYRYPRQIAVLQRVHLRSAGGLQVGQRSARAAVGAVDRDRRVHAG